MYLNQQINLLKQLIATPSLSGRESATAELLKHYLEQNRVEVYRVENNVYAYNRFYDPVKPNILLNSHHDTVKPNNGYTRDPYTAYEENGKIYGLGANDAGASLVTLLHLFLAYYKQPDLPFNLIFAASAEEEISGKNGMEKLLKSLPAIDFAIVGEPTSMDMAVAERGLLVVDAFAHGVASHVAHNNGVNAIDKALDDLIWLRSFSPEKTSDLLGKTLVNVTTVQGGLQHNVIPDMCRFTIDVRLNDCYKHEEILQILNQNLKSDIQERSTRLKPSKLKSGHWMFEVAERLSVKSFGSSTLSDMALMDFDSVKIGPGDTLRSHTADEYVEIEELKQGMIIYRQLMNEMILRYETVAKA